jgi:hypothetical protein
MMQSNRLAEKLRSAINYRPQSTVGEIESPEKIDKD